MAKYLIQRCVKDKTWKEKLKSARESENVKEQIIIIKEVFKTIYEDDDNISLVLSSLSSIFIEFPAKHQVKRVIISLFQSLGPKYDHVIVELLTEQIVAFHSECKDRRYIDLIACLLDNFPLGEKCVDLLSADILKNISTILIKILQEFSQNPSSVRQNELMHDCLAGVQAGNRVIQKCFSSLDSHKHDIWSAFLQHDIQILSTADFLVDCKTTCAINVILLLKLKYREDFIAQVVSAVFLGSNPEFTSLSRGDNLSFLCLLYSTMSVVELPELVTMSCDRKCLLLEYILPSLVDVAELSYQDSVGKLLLVKCYNVWSEKLCSCLRSGLLVEEQKCNLVGGDGILSHVMSCVWTVWEDTTDVVRIIAREIFENTLKIHTMVSCHGDTFLHGLTQRLLYNVSWSNKAKYGMLSSLVQVIGTDYVLQQAPDLSTVILSQMGEHALACHASELYINLCGKQPGVETELWLSTWIDPLLHVLSYGQKQQVNYVVEYILIKLLKKDPCVMPYILQKLSSKADSQQLPSLVMCLRRARTMGFLDDKLGSADTLSQLIDLNTLQQALNHIDEQVRIDAFAFVCDSHKTTAVIMSWEFDLITNFLPWNLNSQSPAFRQQMNSHLKKFLSRMKESETVLLRKVMKSRPTETTSSETEHLQKYKDFLTWLTRHLLMGLHPGSSFARRTSCLSALTLLVDIFGGHSKSGFVVLEVLVEDDFTVLIECLTDTFEDNKLDAYKLLQYCSTIDSMRQTYESVDSLLETALTLAGSTRPQDSTTAAYLFKALLLQAELNTVLTTKSRSKTYLSLCDPPVISIITDSQSGKTLHLLSWLMVYLQFQMKTAQDSLMAAACSKPLYPTLHSIRYLLQDVNFRSIPADDMKLWSNFIADLINSCLLISKIVSPVVQNSSPEGNIPMEAMGNIKEAVEGLMPEYLTVCCWRSIKEVSLVLGVLCTNLPVVNPVNTECIDGLLSCTQIEEIGSYYKMQLLESIHRGAFELAYTGFVQMCDMLWRNKLEELYKLPKIWLSHLMEEIQSVSSKLCATRRSAGVPFYVQALVTTEPIITGRQCFKQTMTDLLTLALVEESDALCEAKVHSLNILRALYKDTRLGEDVTPFVAGGLQAAILGFKSKFWAVCNSSTLLFSALMTRIFGVKRSQDENNISKKNCQTGKAFFHKYPGLYSFMLDQLAEATESVQEKGRFHLHPSLYPLLMVLARLYPSPLEGIDTSLNLSAFVPHILRCNCSPVLRTRQMAARALQPLVIGCPRVLSDLLGQLPVDQTNVHYSQIHGIILQISSIMDIMASIEGDVRDQTIKLVSQEWTKRPWILYSNCCCLVKKEALLLTTKLVDLGDTECTQMLQKLLTTEQRMLTEDTLHGPSSVEYLTTLATAILNYTEILQGIKYSGQEGSSSPGQGGLADRLVLILNAKQYEVRLIGLVYLLYVYSDGVESYEELVFDYKAGPSVLSTNVKSSMAVLNKLLCMARNEQHFECSKLVFKVLNFNPSIQSGSWYAVIDELIQLFRHCLHVIEHCTRDDLRSDALQVTGYLIGPLVESKCNSLPDVRELLWQWRDMLVLYKGTEQHQQLQLAVTKILLHNANLLLEDEHGFWGSSVFTFWDALINLMQEDDDEVKNTAGSVLGVLNKVTIHPYYGIDMTVQLMLHYHFARSPVSCVKVMLGWISLPEEEMNVGGRLFDKNEMNTWREEIQLSKMVTKYLVNISLTLYNLLDTSTHQPSVIAGGDNSLSIEKSPGTLIDDNSLRDLQSYLTDCHPSVVKIDLPLPSSDIRDVWHQLCQALKEYLDKHLFNVLEDVHPFKNINKYIQHRIKKTNIDCIQKLYQCLNI